MRQGCIQRDPYARFSGAANCPGWRFWLAIVKSCGGDPELQRAYTTASAKAPAETRRRIGDGLENVC